MLSIVCLMTAVNPVPPMSTAQQRAMIRTIEAIHQVEASGELYPNPGDGGRAVGPLQIWMCVVKDVNRRYGTHYTSRDRQDLEKSVEICVRYLWMREPTGNPEKWARLWNSGPKWREKRCKTDQYWRRIREAMKGANP